MLAPEIHPAFGDITARLDRTFAGVSAYPAARTVPPPPFSERRDRLSTAEPLSCAGFSDYVLPDFRDFRATTTTAAASAGPTLRSSNLSSSLGATGGDT